ncbi:MAG: hypothetical protein D6781_02800 [Verrucomicrobia bacterium]|nr:MAG: hypothetical protein D6781_02800 [Verrucomicrobiota bacterium]
MIAKPELAYADLKRAFAEQPLFEDKTWRLSPTAWPLTAEQVEELEAIGTACLELYQALETLYRRSSSGRNLLRNRELHAPWAAEYLDRGKPAWLAELSRLPALRGVMPPVIRPDLLLTADGFALTELDSVPGGIGLTAFLNRLFSRAHGDAILGHGDAMIEGFYKAVTQSVATHAHSPVVAIIVSAEASTYRPEMEWLAAELQKKGRRVMCFAPEEVFPLGGALYYDNEGTPEKIDVVYRFYELFDLENVSTSKYILEAWQQDELVITPAYRPFLEEKLSLALFHHHLLQDFWAENLSKQSLRRLRRLIPRSWVVDPAPLPPSAVLDGPTVGGRLMNDWRDLARASQRGRELVLKVSGFHEQAWGARSVIVGSDCSREEWQQGVEHALESGDEHLYVLQEYRKPKRLRHPLYAVDGQGVYEAQGRLRLCPYFFNIGGKAQLAGALATFCPPDKKIIHGMVDAALLPCVRV